MGNHLNGTRQQLPLPLNRGTIVVAFVLIQRFNVVVKMMFTRTARPLGRTFVQQTRKMGGGGGPVPTEGIDGAVR